MSQPRDFQSQGEANVPRVVNMRYRSADSGSKKATEEDIQKICSENCDCSDCMTDIVYIPYFTATIDDIMILNIGSYSSNQAGIRSPPTPFWGSPNPAGRVFSSSILVALL